MRPAKKPSPKIEKLKLNARNILRRIAQGENVLTTVVHLSEVANILESRIPLVDSLDILSGLFALPNLQIKEPTRHDYEIAIEVGRTKSVGVNDSLGWLVMQNCNVSEIYSFDMDFDKFEGLHRLTS